MKRILAALLMLTLFSLCGCRGEETLELYVVPGEHIIEGMTAGEIAAAAKTHGRVALRGEDLAGVDWERQLYRVKNEASQSVSVVTPESGGCSLLKTTGEDVFVWMLNGKALYAGGFNKGGGSAARQRYPKIIDTERYIFAIETNEGEDLRFDQKLYKYFSGHGLLKSEL